MRQSRPLTSAPHPATATVADHCVPNGRSSASAQADDIRGVVGHSDPVQAKETANASGGDLLSSPHPDIDGRPKAEVYAELEALAIRYAKASRNIQQTYFETWQLELDYAAQRGLAEMGVDFVSGIAPPDPNRWVAVTSAGLDAQIAFAEGRVDHGIRHFQTMTILGQSASSALTEYLHEFAGAAEGVTTGLKITSAIAFSAAALLALPALTAPAIGMSTTAAVGTIGVGTGAATGVGTLVGELIAPGEPDFGLVARNSVEGMLDGLMNAGFGVIGKSMSVNKLFRLDPGSLAKASSSWLWRAVSWGTKNGLKGAWLEGLRATAEEAQAFAIDPNARVRWREDPAGAFADYQQRLRSALIVGFATGAASGVVDASTQRPRTRLGQWANAHKQAYRGMTAMDLRTNLSEILKESGLAAGPAVVESLTQTYLEASREGQEVTAADLRAALVRAGLKAAGDGVVDSNRRAWDLHLINAKLNARAK